MQLEVDSAPRGDGSGRHRVARTPHTTHPTQQPLIVLNRRAATRPTITGVERFTDEVIGRLEALAPDRYVVAQPRPRARGRLLAHAWVEHRGQPLNAGPQIYRIFPPFDRAIVPAGVRWS